MGETKTELKGPDLERGVAFSELREGEPLLGHAHGDAVVLVRRGDACFAVGATCTHYSGPLAEGIVVGETIRCPWHHARYDLATGAPHGGPGMNALPCYEIVRAEALVRVGPKRAPAAPAKFAGTAPSSVVIVGSGTAATLVAETLRAKGYQGPVTMVGEEGIPIDRPNLSKDYLAGTAPEEWMPIRDNAAFAEKKITLVQARAKSIELAKKRVTVDGHADLEYGALVLATGAVPIKLTIPGADLAHVHLLRTLADSRAIASAAGSAKKAVIIGGGFIGLEAAASLRARKVDVTVVLRESVPLERVLGEVLGRFVEAIHTEHGVTFVRGAASKIEPGRVTLDGGKTLDADLVVMGVGVRPRAELAQLVGIKVDAGIVVDDRLRTSAPDVFAVGDVARFPWGPARTLVRVEHWVHAERMGFVAAGNLLGENKPFNLAPFFWSQHYDVPIAYVGAGPWDKVEVHGDPQKRDVLAVYRGSGRIVAAASIYRDQASLRIEELLERGDDAAIEKLVQPTR